MAQERNSGKYLNFTGSGTQTIAMADNEFANVFQVDINIDNDSTIEIKLGSDIIFSGSLVAKASPIQLFLYDFGRGRGTGVKGADLHITLGTAGKVFLTYVKNID